MRNQEEGERREEEEVAGGLAFFVPPPAGKTGKYKRRGNGVLINDILLCAIPECHCIHCIMGVLPADIGA
jgi:hypothetical protein